MFLTEQTPKINRLTDRSNFSRIPNPTVVWMLDSHPVRLEDPPRVHVLRGGRAGESPQQLDLPPAALVGQGKVVEQAGVPLGQAPLWPGGGGGDGSGQRQQQGQFGDDGGQRQPHVGTGLACTELLSL